MQVRKLHVDLNENLLIVSIRLSYLAKMTFVHFFFTNLVSYISLLQWTSAEDFQIKIFKINLYTVNIKNQLEKNKKIYYSNRKLKHFYLKI